jgi:hypothetical protein
MPSVTVDQEEVVFDGGIPTEPNKVYDLLMGVLAGQGRVVVAFVVDGVDSLREESNPTSFEKIEVATQTHHELTLRLIMETMKHLIHVEEEFLAYACNVLKTPWSEVFQRMDQLINKIKPFAELLDNLTPYVETYHPPWQQEFERISHAQADALDKILIAFEKGNPADLSQELAGGFLSVFKEGTTFLKNDSIPYLKEKVTEGATL